MPENDFSRFLRHQAMLEAQQNAASAAREAASETRALRAQMALQDAERGRKEREDVFGTMSFCTSCVAQALEINPGLMAVVKEHYANLLVKEIDEAISELQKWESRPGFTIPHPDWEQHLAERVELLAETFGPLPEGTASALRHLRDEVGAVKVRQAARVEAVAKRREESAKAVLYFLLVLTVIGTIVLWMNTIEPAQPVSSIKLPESPDTQSQTLRPPASPPKATRTSRPPGRKPIRHGTGRNSAEPEAALVGKSPSVTTPAPHREDTEPPPDENLQTAYRSLVVAQRSGNRDRIDRWGSVFRTFAETYKQKHGERAWSLMERKLKTEVGK